MSLIKLRGDTTANWTSVNPVLADREPGIDTDTRVLKIGDGITAWNDLAPVADLYPDWNTVVLAAYQQWLDDGNTGTIEEYLATLVGAEYGAVIDNGSTPPASPTTVDGKPIIWLTGQSLLTPVAATPTMPAIDYVNRTVTAPNTAGVEYQIVDGANIIPLVPLAATSLAGFARPFTLTLQAVALPGYVLTGTYVWQRQFIDSATLPLWASDSFAGVAGTQLADNTNTTRRTMDMALGGTASGGAIPVWYNLSGGLKIKDADPTKAVKFTGTGADASHGEDMFLVGASDFAVEIDVTGFLVEHSEGFTVYLGATALNSLVAPVGVQVYYDAGGGAQIRWPSSGSVASRNDTWKAPTPTEASLLGTYRFTWVNKFAQVVTPDGQVFGKDYSAATAPIGQYSGIGVSNFNTRTRWAEVDGIRVYRS